MKEIIRQYGASFLAVIMAFCLIQLVMRIPKETCRFLDVEEAQVEQSAFDNYWRGR